MVFADPSLSMSFTFSQRSACCLLVFAVLGNFMPYLLAQTTSPTSRKKKNLSDDSRARQKAQATFRQTLARFARDRNLTLARQGFLAAAQMDPSYPQPHFNLGVLAESEEKWDEAGKAYADCLRRQPEAELKSKTEQAIERLKKIGELARTPEGKARWRYEQVLLKAQALGQMGLVKEAVAQTAAAAKTDNSRWEAYALAGSLLSQQNLCNEATGFFQQALERAPAEKKTALEQALQKCRKEQMYRNLAQTAAAAAAVKDYAVAAHNFTQAWELFPERGEYGLAAATCLVMAGKNDAASIILTMLQEDRDPQTARKAREIMARIDARKKLPGRTN